jgi:hypothetical protein
MAIPLDPKPFVFFEESFISQVVYWEGLSGWMWFEMVIHSFKARVMYERRL